jgi:hypothetical protein
MLQTPDYPKTESLIIFHDLLLTAYIQYERLSIHRNIIHHKAWLLQYKTEVYRLAINSKTCKLFLCYKMWNTEGSHRWKIYFCVTGS